MKIRFLLLPTPSKKGKDGYLKLKRTYLRLLLAPHFLKLQVILNNPGFLLTNFTRKRLGAFGELGFHT